MPRVSRRVVVCIGALAVAPTSGFAQGPRRTIEIAIANRRADGAEVVRSGRTAGVVRVRQGEHVELIWRSDEPARLHLHGYNVEVHVSGDGTLAAMTFIARATGRFVVETHGIGKDRRRHLALLYVEVHPR